MSNVNTLADWMLSNIVTVGLALALLGVLPIFIFSVLRQRREAGEPRQHYCQAKQAAPRLAPAQPGRDSGEGEGSFVTSAIVGAATNSTVIGWAVGGSLVGAAVGDALAPDSSPSSFDSGSVSSCASDDSTE